jgi:long-subunit acyl-CoA synthetase (AMP-forming)
MGRPLSEKQNLHAPIRALEVMKNGQLRPLQYVNEKGDVRRLSGQFLLSVQRLWEQRGDEILHRVADEHPALVFMAMVKIAAVQRIEVGQPDDFSGLKSKQAIVEKLEERAGPEARKLFETFIKKVEALEDEKGENGSGDR